MFAHSRDGAEFCGRDPWGPARPGPAAHKEPLGTAERRLGLRLSPATCGGFSLLELMVSMAVLSVIAGGIVSAVSSSTQTYKRTELKSDMYENVRGVAELMAQEIGQAGLVSLPASTLGTAVTASATAQTVTVSSTTSMFVNEQVLVDAGTNEELVTLSNVTATTITTIFGKPHAAAAPINALGAFPAGIVPPGTTDGSTANVLNLFGDINADGSLVYVRYTCTPGTTTAPGTLTRSVTTITPGVDTSSASQSLLSTVVGGTGAVCFQYTTASASGFTFVTNVGFTLSVQATRPDPQNGVYPQMTKSFLNLAPRNVLAGLELANAGITNRLQATPANVLAY
jgi:prepilin-type N-terminal cleavage/methylation domain-containing protein